MQRSLVEIAILIVLQTESWQLQVKRFVKVCYQNVMGRDWACSKIYKLSLGINQGEPKFQVSRFWSCPIELFHKGTSIN